MNSQKLKKMRAELGMTQQELADALGIQRNTVNRYEMGLLELPKTVHLAVSYLLLQHRSQLAKEQMEKKRAEVKSRAKKR